MKACISAGLLLALALSVSGCAAKGINGARAATLQYVPAGSSVAASRGGGSSAAKAGGAGKAVGEGPGGAAAEPGALFEGQGETAAGAAGAVAAGKAGTSGKPGASAGTASGKAASGAASGQAGTVSRHDAAARAQQAFVRLRAAAVRLEFDGELSGESLPNTALLQNSGTASVQGADGVGQQLLRRGNVWQQLQLYASGGQLQACCRYQSGDVQPASWAGGWQSLAPSAVTAQTLAQRFAWVLPDVREDAVESAAAGPSGMTLCFTADPADWAFLPASLSLSGYDVQRVEISLTLSSDVAGTLEQTVTLAGAGRTARFTSKQTFETLDSLPSGKPDWALC